MTPVRLRIALAAAACVSVAACSVESSAPASPLADTLLFLPGTVVQYQGQEAKLYGTSTCHVGSLMGPSCVLLAPNKPSATALIVTPSKVQEVTLHAKRDPQNPAIYVLEDHKGHRLLSTNGEENLLDFIHMGL